MKPEFVRPETLLERSLPACRFLNYPQSAAANMPTPRHMKATKPGLPSSENGPSSTGQTEPSGIALAGMTIYAKR